MEEKQNFLGCNSATAKRFVFTLPNYTEADILHLQNLPKDVLRFLICAKEVCPHTQTPHLQGYLELFKDSGFAGIHKLIHHDWNPETGRFVDFNCRFWVQAARHKRETNLIYCCKGEQSHAEYDLQGTAGPHYGLNADSFTICNDKKKGIDKHEKALADLQAAPADLPTFIAKNPEIAFKSYSNIEKIAASMQAQEIKNNLIAEFSDIVLRDWQAGLVAEVSQPLKTLDPKNRLIIWYYDRIGASGKTIIANYLACVHGAALYSGASNADILHAYKGENIALFDFTRTKEGYVNYSIIEQIKSNVLFSPKYESKTKYRPGGVYVVCFANFLPDRSKLSADRWDIRYLDRGELYNPNQHIIDNLPDGI